MAVPSPFVPTALHGTGVVRTGTARDLLILTKPRITVLSVFTAAAGMILAGGATGALAAAVLAGTALLVGSANTLNMYLERDVDGLMVRTAGRPLPAGRLAPGLALASGLAQAAIAIPVLALGGNLLAGALGALALVLYVLVYTPLKRVTPLALLVGAVPGAMPPLIGWTAVSGRLDLAGLALFGVLFVWQVPHFLAIALFRRDDYAAAGLKVLPAVRGEEVTRRAIVRYLVAQLAVTLALVPLGLGGVPYLVGAAVAGAFMLAWGVAGLARDVGPRWARGLFLASIIYLPLVLGLLFV